MSGKAGNGEKRTGKKSEKQHKIIEIIPNNN